MRRANRRFVAAGWLRAHGQRQRTSGPEASKNPPHRVVLRIQLTMASWRGCRSFPFPHRSHGLLARLPGLLRRAGDGERGGPRGQGAGRPLAAGDAGLSVRQGGQISRPRLRAGADSLPVATQSPARPKGRCNAGASRRPSSASSWDEALDAIAARLEQIADRYGPESILPYSYAGTIGVLGYGSMDRRFFHRLGASQLDRTICSEAGGVAWNLVYGKKLGTPTEDFRLAKLILAWGANIHGNNIHLWPMVEQARRNGARLIVIDPYRTRTAALADWHIAIRPGTDAALALGMMHVILNEGLEDRAYIDEMTHGFEQLAERAREYTPERVAAWTGMTRGRGRAAGARVRHHAACRDPPELRRAARARTAARPCAPLPCCRRSPAHGSIAAAARSFPPPARSRGTSRRWSGPTWRWLRRWAGWRGW